MSTPVLAQLLERRATGWVIGAAALAHLVLMRFDLPAWQCTVRDAVGIPCPGCGLSRAITALVHGQWRDALTLHAFAPVILAGLVLVTGMALLPEAARRRGISAVARFEQRTGLTALLLLTLVGYWLTRLIFFRSAFIDSTR
ncbi:DUF2752 domain-containing protein [Myxococcus sp. RHSTA-1-4]|uniref:DUF2752 domain-containing protein n=1 Tax=Myxococcus sp. RHSTA-1-4 TaxID=2874601 RepID=UPI001CBDB40E|nr:DUF2752 domain-containing protein [Myxococcus sp. RHSTA-1-4]MBZ4418120.1 DUF2752 domain-containing protein [Myxococcus sp. RHSTA-1-4]